MLEFSGWFTNDPAPVDTLRPTGTEGTVWAAPGNVLEGPGERLTFGDGTGGGPDRTRTHVRRHGAGDLAVVGVGTLVNASELRSTLRARGHETTGEGWADLVAAAFLEWGIHFPEHLEGSFAIAVRDQDRTLHLIRDRMGVKPLYFHSYDGGIAFSTRAGRVLTHPATEPWMTPQGLLLALNPRLVMPGETPVSGLCEVPPGHTMTFKEGHSTQTCYWRLESGPHTDGHERTVARVRELLGETVAAYLAVDPELGVLMSGGLDSTAVAAYVSTLRERGGDAGRLRTYSLEFDTDTTNFKPSALRPEPDGPYARRVAKELGTDHQAIVLSTAQLTAAGQEAREARGMPGWGQFDTSFLVMAKTIRQECATVLTGSFADEIFGGYPWFHDPEVLAADTFPWLGNAPRVWAGLSREFIENAQPERMEQERYHALLAKVPRLPGDSPEEARMREALFLSLQGPTAVNQERGERMSAAAGLSAPSPYTDHKLLQYVWNVPWSEKSRPPGWKYLLKAAVADMVPQVVLDRPKSGYPGTHDPVYAQQTMDALKEIADNPAAPLHPLMDQDRLRRFTSAADGTMTFISAAHMLIPVVETNAWMERFGVKVR
ncbi:asparagine synthetase B family protein [Streptomyces sp. NPDC003032]